MSALGSFKTRTISGIVLIVIMTVLLVAGGDLLFAALLAISCIGMYELYKLTKIHRSVPGILGYVAAAVYYILIRTGHEEKSLAVFVTLLICLMFAYVFTYPAFRAEQIMTVPFGLLYVAVMLSFIYRIRVLDGGKYLVWLVLGCSWAADTCAYLVGVRFGRHKITPKLSPKKSLEGCIGGVLGSGLFGSLYGLLLNKFGVCGTKYILYFGIMCMLGSIVGQIGDLAASGIKRNYEIKDYGKLIPGHGGVMDRFDSMILISPLVYYICYYLLK